MPIMSMPSEPPSEQTSANSLLELSSALQKIESKLENSPVLNGGFEKLIYKVDYISHKLDDTTKKLENIHESLFDMPNGLISKVIGLESETESLQRRVSEKAKIQDELKEKQDQHTLQIQPVLQFKKTVDRITWAIFATTLTVIGKLVWDIVSMALPNLSRLF